MSEIRINYNLSKKDGLEELNTILGEFSFIGGHTGANSCDVDVLNALGKSDFSAYPNIKRWHKYISSFSPEERKKWNVGFIAIEGYEAPEEVEEEEINLFEMSEEEEQALLKKKEEDKKKGRRSKGNRKESYHCKIFNSY